MKKDTRFLIQRIKSLEKRLAEKDRALCKYRETLSDSSGKIQQITKDMEEALSLIREAHKRLVPLRLPRIPHFEFSYKFLPAAAGVSGDFFDVIRIKKSLKFAVVLSSCSSYAAASLFLSSFLKSAARLRGYESSKDFLAYISEALLSSGNWRDGQSADPVHLFYGIIDRRDFSLDYCLAGNIFAGFRAFGESFQVLEPCADSACQKSASLFKSRRISINPKDSLLLCSPGISQRRNRRREVFGSGGILQAAAGAKNQDVLEVRQSVLFQCREFGGGLPAAKDRTILAIEAKDKILKLKDFRKAKGG